MIESDPRLKRVLANIEKRRPLDLKKMTDDALAHLNNLPPVPNNSKAIITTSRIMADSRAKLIAIKLTILKELSLIEGAHSDLEFYLQAKYLSFLNGVKNQQGRASLVGRALTPLSKQIRKLQTAFKIVETVIREYETRSYAVNHVIEALKIGEREAG